MNRFIKKTGLTLSSSMNPKFPVQHDSLARMLIALEPENAPGHCKRFCRHIRNRGWTADRCLRDRSGKILQGWAASTRRIWFTKTQGDPGDQTDIDHNTGNKRRAPVLW